HLEVEEIYAAPIFSETLDNKAREYASTNRKHLTGLLRRAKLLSGESAVAVVITRPPEIILCLIIPVENQEVFAIFDSHPRPKHPDGAAFIFNTSLEGTTTYLTQLLGYDAQLLMDREIQWEAQMLAHFSGHVFVAKDKPDIPSVWLNALIRASLSALSLKADVVSLQSQNNSLASDNSSLGRDIQRLQTELRMLKQEQHRQGNGQRSATARKGKARDESEIGPSTYLSSMLWPWRMQVDGASTERKRLDQSSATSPPQSPSNQEEEDLRYAMQMQLEYSLEDSVLHDQMLELQATAQRTFDCVICLEKLPEDYIAPLDSCAHRFCTECLRSYVQSKLQEGRFPIFCPVCMTGDGSKHEYPEDYQTFVEFEMTAFSILIHCRQCKESVFVDKGEYSEMEILTSAVAGGTHSCDGSNELKDLMEQRGWKNCPGCQTPAEKVEGCNHMTCPTPGCNSHFCYRCGQMIVQSVRQQEVSTAVSNHYRSCSLFHYD
ncbi:hypothetical protein GLOTRDRAFT_33666, partial [Gloeophyllum trabeum ATCC 11539]